MICRVLGTAYCTSFIILPSGLLPMSEVRGVLCLCPMPAPYPLALLYSITCVTDPCISPHNLSFTPVQYQNCLWSAAFHEDSNSLPTYTKSLALGSPVSMLIHLRVQLKQTATICKYKVVAVNLFHLNYCARYWLCYIHISYTQSFGALSAHNVYMSSHGIYRRYGILWPRKPNARQAVTPQGCSRFAA